MRGVTAPRHVYIRPQSQNGAIADSLRIHSQKTTQEAILFRGE